MLLIDLEVLCGSEETACYLLIDFVDCKVVHKHLFIYSAYKLYVDYGFESLASQ